MKTLFRLLFWLAMRRQNTALAARYCAAGALSDDYRAGVADTMQTLGLWR
jgi:hypothetical protein